MLFPFNNVSLSHSQIIEMIHIQFLQGHQEFLVLSFLRTVFSRVSNTSF